QIRYIDASVLDNLLERVQQFNVQLSQNTVDFLLQENALKPYEQQINIQKEAVQGVAKVIDAQSIEQACLQIAAQLELLIDILNSLKIEDTTQTTKIIENIS